MIACPECHSSQAADSLVCDNCSTLIYRDKLREFYNAFKKSETEKKWQECLDCLQKCIQLVPAHTRQYQQFTQEFQRISHYYNHQPVTPDPQTLESIEKTTETQPAIKDIHKKINDRFSRPDSNWLVRHFFKCIGTILYSFSLVLISMKIILTGLTKKRTFVSLIVWIVSLSFLLGWEKALGFGLMIYMHEIGHLIAIQYYGYKFAWPFFVPFVGAFVLQGKATSNARERAVVSLAGPLTGIMVSVVLYTVLRFLPFQKIFSQLIYLNLMINLLNLLPFWILDGARLADLYDRKHLAAIAIGLIPVSWFFMNGFSLLLLVSYFLRIILQTQIIQSQSHRLPEATEDRDRLWGIVFIQFILIAASIILSEQLSPTYNFLQNK